MFDIQLRPIKDLVVNPLARTVGRLLSPNAITLISLLIGLGAAAAVWFGMIKLGLLLWALNRITDGMDGAVARINGLTSDLGGYLDIVADFLVYAALPVAFVVNGGIEGLALPALVLLAAFYVNAGSWMYLSAVLEKRGRHGRGEITSVTMPEGIIGGTETVIFFTLFFLLPGRVALLFWLMAVLTFVSAGQRVAWAQRKL